MKSLTRKIAAGALTLTMAATAVPLTATTADAGWRGHGYHGHYRPAPRHYYHRRSNDGALAAGVIGLAAGALIGGAIASQPAPAPVYREYRDYRAYRPEMSRADWDAYCYSKYRSYDARTGTYLGYDGYRHYCQ
ncbi:BA14K family protein [Lutibaculum baratangense]|uniref:Lectin-like protein BA14k n=1 Tax=Lutibaculum baratangense AMV1 TaxID=631454 RepID=V4RGR6_9HYPH|nr:BA14K family protein [Lutibaculum baratangense]ESR24549.1 hypothetical protein N177_2383 [Lutibaculum baratangense AMV1]